MIRSISFLLLFFGVLSLKSQSVPAHVLDSLFTLYEEKDKLSGSVGMMKDGQVLYRRSIGYQNIKEKRKNDSLTVYPIGRVTELFVQVLFFQLEEEGKLRFSDKLSAYYPEIPNSDKITLGQLLRHKSGLKLTDSLYVYNTREKATQYLQKYPEFKKDEYSNFDYLLLGFIFEDISGKGFDELVKSKIIEKAALKNTFYGENFPEENTAVSYYKQSGVWKTRRAWAETEDYKTTSGMYSTPQDLNVFMMALFDGKFFSRKTVDKYIREKDRKKRFSFYYQEEKNWYSLNGNFKGFQIQLRYSDKDNISMCIISNANDNMGLDFLFDALRDSYYARPVKFPTILTDK
ncbi:MAG: beta-lactamase family protein [Flavobacteriaceae bacterium]|jgi:CubicO group peptidase (beta-lactamase class C family)|nr:beta-lactamase family protein [Flavobacteriaceae bacterium]